MSETVSTSYSVWDVVRACSIRARTCRVSICHMRACSSTGERYIHPFAGFRVDLRSEYPCTIDRL